MQLSNRGRREWKALQQYPRSVLLLRKFVKQLFELPMFIMFPSPSGNLTAVKCVGELLSLKLSKAETIWSARWLSCQATACLCIVRWYVSTISLKYQYFIHSYLVLKKKDLSPFHCLSFAPSHVPHPVCCCSWLKDSKSLLLMLLMCPLRTVSSCASFFACIPNMKVLVWSTLNAWSISLDVFRVLGMRCPFGKQEENYELCYCRVSIQCKFRRNSS